MDYDLAQYILQSIHKTIKIVCDPKKIKTIKENPNTKYIEYNTITTRVSGYVLDGHMYVESIAQI